MPAMKRLLVVTVFLTCTALLCSAQTPGQGTGAATGAAGSPAATAVQQTQPAGFGSSGAAGAMFQGGDPAQITQRIMSTTRYRVTPGDIYQLSVTQSGITSYTLVLQENYDLQVPYMDTINVKGMYFADLRKLIIARMKKLLPLADFVSLTLQSPARFDVAVFGGVQTPGMITVTALTRVSDAIVAAGRRVPGATYRQIALMRGDARITVDLQRYSSDGQSEENPYLQPEDKIFVPQADVTVTLTGQVRYPGTFELIPGETLNALLGYAGNTLPDANVSKIAISRFQPGGLNAQRIVNLATDSGIALSDGDIVRIPARVESGDMILVTGALFGAPAEPGKPVPIPVVPIALNIPYRPGISLLSVLESLGGPTPYAQSKESYIIHKKTGQRSTVDVDTLWSTRDPTKDFPLEPGDTVSVPILTQVFVAGSVVSPGKQPFDPGMKVGDYIVASGGIDPINGDPNGIFFVDRSGGRTHTTLSAPIFPGAVIMVMPNDWATTQLTFKNVTIVTGFVAAVIAFLTTMIDFIRIFVPTSK
jgi:protein involved in polysaccharide export with SLBB domain